MRLSSTWRKKNVTLSRKGRPDLKYAGYFSSVTWSPWTHSTNSNGPVLTGLRAGSAASPALRLTIHVAARLVKNGPNEFFRWKIARVGLATSTLSSAVYWTATGLAVLGSVMRSNEYLASSAGDF